MDTPIFFFENLSLFPFGVTVSYIAYSHVYILTQAPFRFLHNFLKHSLKHPLLLQIRSCTLFIISQLRGLRISSNKNHSKCECIIDDSDLASKLCIYPQHMQYETPKPSAIKSNQYSNSTQYYYRVRNAPQRLSTTSDGRPRKKYLFNKGSNCEI